jgi:endoglycosylceramidase
MDLMKLCHALITFFVVLSLCSQGVSATLSWIRDDENRAVILHGLNMSNAAKYAPNQMSWQTYEDYKKICTDWGFNCIRLLIFWSAIEPEPGVYNDTYLDAIEERVAWAGDLGIYVILDMHQDLYSAQFGGDGAPDWAVWDDGCGFTSMHPWWVNYLQPAVRHAFKNFWTSEELRSHFIHSWVHVADRFRNTTNVLGYDVLNEPYAGTFLPRSFETLYLNDFYLEVINALRSVDQNHYIFYEPQIMTSSGMKSVLPPIDSEKLVYAPHFYQPTVHEGFPYLGSKFFMKRTLGMRDDEADNANVPWFLGEFGVEKNSYGGEWYVKNLVELLNADAAGWTYWAYDYDTQNEFGIINETGAENMQLQFLVYPYPQKIAGDPIDFNYDFESKRLHLEFYENRSVSGPSELSLSQNRVYPEGFSVWCSDPPGTWSWGYASSTDTILVWTNSTDAIHRIEISPSTSFKTMTLLG